LKKFQGLSDEVAMSLIANGHLQIKFLDNLSSFNNLEATTYEQLLILGGASRLFSEIEHFPDLLKINPGIIHI